MEDNMLFQYDQLHSEHTENLPCPVPLRSTSYRLFTQDQGVKMAKQIYERLQINPTRLKPEIRGTRIHHE